MERRTRRNSSSSEPAHSGRGDPAPSTGSSTHTTVVVPTYPHQPPYPPYQEPPTPPGVTGLLRESLRRPQFTEEDIRRWRERRRYYVNLPYNQARRAFGRNRRAAAAAAEAAAEAEPAQQGESSRTGAEKSQHGSARGGVDNDGIPFRPPRSGHPDLARHPFFGQMQTAAVVGDRGHSPQGSGESGVQIFPGITDPMDAAVNSMPPMPPIPPLPMTPENAAKANALNKKQENMWSFGRRRHHPDERQQPWDQLGRRHSPPAGPSHTGGTEPPPAQTQGEPARYPPGSVVVHGSYPLPNMPRGTQSPETWPGRTPSNSVTAGPQPQPPPLPQFPENNASQQDSQTENENRRCPSCNRPLACYWSLRTTLFRNHRRRGEPIPRPRRSLGEFCFRCLGRKLKDKAAKLRKSSENGDDGGQAA